MLFGFYFNVAEFAVHVWLPLHLLWDYLAIILVFVEIDFWTAQIFLHVLRICMEYRAGRDTGTTVWFQFSFCSIYHTGLVSVTIHVRLFWDYFGSCWDWLYYYTCILSVMRIYVKYRACRDAGTTVGFQFSCCCFRAPYRFMYRYNSCAIILGLFQFLLRLTFVLCMYFTCTVHLCITPCR